MRKLFSTAILAVFFSLYLSGCYTRFGNPEPKTGENVRHHDYTYDDYDYWDYISPGFYGYPYYSYGFFYSPWWYDQIYYYYIDDDYSSESKIIRSRDHNNPLPPPPSSGGIVTPLNQPSSGEVRIKSGGESQEQSGDEGALEKKEKTDGKAVRRRR